MLCQIYSLRKSKKGKATKQKKKIEKERNTKLNKMLGKDG